MDKILENKKIVNTLKILTASILSISIAIILLIKIDIKTKKQQDVKISISKSERSNYPKTETVWGVLEIPSAKIKTNIYKGNDELLNYGALHHKESYFPKDGGTILIAGNNEVFKNLSKVKANDKIILTTMYGTYTYKVEKTRIKSKEELSNSLEIKSDEEKLVLYTGYPETKGYQSDRLVVYAK